MTMENDKVMNNDNLKVLAINSLPSNGNAGLKMVMGVLGNRVIPVPTLLLSGTGNMKGHLRFKVPFSRLLESSLSLAEENGEKLILYIGYLGDSSQAKNILDNISRFKENIDYILVDPVCGDNGNAYVAENIIDSWHQLLPKADLITPNITELALLLGFSPPFDFSNPEKYIQIFQGKYPGLSMIVSGWVCEKVISNFLFHENIISVFNHTYVPGYFSGAGDTFTSLFIRYHFYEKLSMKESLQRACKMMETLMLKTVETGIDMFFTSCFLETAKDIQNLKSN